MWIPEYQQIGARSKNRQLKSILPTQERDALNCFTIFLQVLLLLVFSDRLSRPKRDITKAETSKSR